MTQMLTVVELQISFSSFSKICVHLTPAHINVNVNRITSGTLFYLLKCPPDLEDSGAQILSKYLLNNGMSICYFHYQRKRGFYILHLFLNPSVQLRIQCFSFNPLYVIFSTHFWYQTTSPSYLLPIYRLL